MVSRDDTPSTGDARSRAWLFDIDGVITDPRTKRIERLEILDEIMGFLKRGEPVGLNTGRSLPHVEDRVLDVVDRRYGVLQDVSGLFVAGEKGAVWMSLDAEGRRSPCVDPHVISPSLGVLTERVAALLADDTSTPMFLDETKRATVTLEMLDGADLDDFRHAQRRLVPQLHRLLAELDLAQVFRVDATQIAIDIEPARLGKALGAARFVEHLAGRGLSPTEYTAFGDSPSDVEMATHLHGTGADVTLVYVGEPSGLPGGLPDTMTVVQPTRRFDAGTLEFFLGRR